MVAPNNSGTIFSLATNGAAFTVLKNFSALGYAGSVNSVNIYTNSDGANPGYLTFSGGILYGTAQNGGTSGKGTVFKMGTNGTGFATIKTFAGSDGANPQGLLTLSASTLYGTTYGGGTLGYGTVFKVNTDGTGLALIKSFSNNDGANPLGLLLAGGTLYGTTARGGTSVNSGTVFKVNTNGTGFAVLKNFPLAVNNNNSIQTNSDGYNPNGNLLLITNTLYGTTCYGGANGAGTIFSVTTNGTGFAVLRTFSTAAATVANMNYSINDDGANPVAGLIGSGGTFYGTTRYGGSPGLGTVFKMNADGTGFSLLKNFIFSDGAHPPSNLIVSDGVIYGTTQDGGTNNLGTVFKVNLDGTGYTVAQDIFPRRGLTTTGS